MGSKRFSRCSCVVAVAMLAGAVGGAEPGAAQGGQRTEAELRAPSWWLKRAVEEALRVEDLPRRVSSLLYAGHQLADRGELEEARGVAQKIEDLLKANPEVKPANEPRWLRTVAEVQHSGEVGKFEEGLALAEREAETGRKEGLIITLVAAMSQKGQVEALRAAAKNASLRPEMVKSCISGIVNEGRLRRDKAMIQGALALLPRPGDPQNLLANCIHACMPMGKPVDAAGVWMLIEMMPEGPARGDEASQNSRNLAQKGFVEEARALALLVPVTGRRAEALGDLAQAMALAGDAAGVRKLIAAETDVNCKAKGVFGLALGLALRGESDGAGEALKELPPGERGGDPAELEVAVAQGILLKKDFPAGLAALRAAPNPELRRRAISKAAEELIAKGRLTDAEQVVGLYEEDTFYFLVEKGRLYRMMGQEYRAAKNMAGVKRVLGLVDAMRPKIPEKNAKEGMYRLAGVHAYLGDLEGAQAVIAELPEADRATGPETLANACAEAGDLAGAVRALAGGKFDEHAYSQIAKMGATNGDLRAVAAWIDSWPEAAGRSWGYAVVASSVAERVAREEAAAAATRAHH
jgi:hypothetical protein